MLHSRCLPLIASSFALALYFCASPLTIAQSSGKQPESTSSSQQQQTPPDLPDVSQPPPKPGDLGWPFPNEHWWNHWALEFGGGYTPVVSKGTGYLDHGYVVTAGVVDHVRSDLNLLFEFQFFGLQGVQQYAQLSNTDFGANLGLSYAFLSRAAYSPYILGAGGFYSLGTIPPPGGVQPCINAFNCPTNAANEASKPGFLAGIGVRRKLFADKQTAIFAECRYHYIASGSTAFGQVSLLPVSAGLRW